MLYVSTRSNTDVYTAYRALHEKVAPDGGFFFPFRIPSFSKNELDSFKKQGPGGTIAGILNLFFGQSLSAWDVECIIGRAPFRILPMNYRLLVAELWHNPGLSWEYLLKNIYALLIGKNNNAVPEGWVLIAIEIALFFGLYSVMDFSSAKGIDIAVTSGDFSDAISVLLSKDMGLPVNRIICVFNENGAVWDFINKGELSTGTAAVKTIIPELDRAVPVYLEYLLARCFDSGEVVRYVEALNSKTNYYINEESLRLLGNDLYAAVVSSNRIEQIISSVNRKNQYRIEPYSALVYGGLQDYRAYTGISKETLILIKRKEVST